MEKKEEETGGRVFISFWWEGAKRGPSSVWYEITIRDIGAFHGGLYAVGDEKRVENRVGGGVEGQENWKIGRTRYTEKKVPRIYDKGE